MTLLAGTSYGIEWTWHRLHLARRDLTGLALPVSQLVCASVQLLVLLSAWWALGGAGLATPWTTHSGEVLMPLLPVLALGVLVLGEHITAWTLVGFTVVLAGALLVGFGNRWTTALAARRG